MKTVKLGEILKESKIVSTRPDSNRRIRVKLNVGGVDKRPDTTEKKGATKYFVRKAGQFIYGRQNLHKGAFGIVPHELDGFESSSDIPAFDVHESCLPEWIFYFFKYQKFYLKLDAFAKGVGSKRISTKQIFDLTIPLPTKDEQNRVIKIFKQVEKKVTVLQEELTKSHKLLEKLKDTFLTEAIEGKLTENWRQANKKVESGQELLYRIRHNNKSKAKKEPAASKAKIIDDQTPFELPESWTWCQYSDLNAPGTNVSYGVLIPDAHVSDGVPLIRVGDLDGAGNGTMPFKYISQEIANKYKRTQLNGGELLTVLVGASIGKTVIAHANWRGANIARAVSRTVVNPLVSSWYLQFVVQSSFMQDYFKKMTHSVGQPTLNVSVISCAHVPLPPIAEQLAIVEKIQGLLNIYLDLQKQFYSAESKLNIYLEACDRDLFIDFASNFAQVQPPLTMIPVLKRGIDESEKLDSYKYNSSIMELEQLLEENGKMSAISLWQMSKFENDINAFYDELKRLVEDKKTVKESNVKGFLELAK